MLVTEVELEDFAKQNCISNPFFIMPLSKRTAMSDCRVNHHDSSKWLKFETDAGRKGFYCPSCGIIHKVELV